MSIKRSNQKRITKRAEVIRYLRISKGMSQRDVSRRCRLSEAAIGHYEHGRMEVSEARLDQLLSLYGCSREKFDDHLSAPKMPTVRIREDCMNLLTRINEAKLQVVHSVLLSFAS